MPGLSDRYGGTDTKTIDPVKLSMRLDIYCLGLLILAFGIALGTCTTLIYVLYILLQVEEP